MTHDRAPQSGKLWNVVRTLGIGGAVIAVGFGVVPWALMKLHWAIGDTRMGFPPSRRLGLTLCIVFAASYLCCGVALALIGRGTTSRFFPPRRLVTTGPYAHVRNPMVLAAMCQAFAVALYGGSLLLVAYPFAGLALWSLLVRGDEEYELVRKFGRPYEVYRRGVPLLIPALRAWRPMDDAPTRTMVISEEVQLRQRRRRA